MNLIEQLGGYEKAKLEWEREGAYPSPNYFYYRELGYNLLQYRREHNIFEVGDKVVCINSRRYKVYQLPENKNHWLYLEEIRHATPEEIQAGERNV